MANTIKQFDFRLLCAGKDSDGLRRPYDPLVVLELKHYGGGDDEAPSISPNLASAHEIDEHVRELKRDLDAVAARAKRALTRERNATMADVTRRLEKRSSEE
jgi:hypothetical protein